MRVATMGVGSLMSSARWIKPEFNAHRATACKPMTDPTTSAVLPEMGEGDLETDEVMARTVG